mgnify:CR=1 FL=1
MILSDIDIRERCVFDKKMISPFVNYPEKKNQTGCITWGITSAGYDVRLGYDFKSYKHPGNEIDPKNPDDDNFYSFSYSESNGNAYAMEPNEFLLGTTLEVFDIPSDIWGLCISRSTYARHGIICHTTPLVPGFRGQVTLEIKNTSDQNVLIYPGEGICQFVFSTMTSKPLFDYAACGGKYMDQRGTTGPKA